MKAIQAKKRKGKNVKKLPEFYRDKLRWALIRIIVVYTPCVVFLRPVLRGDLEEEVAVSDEEVESGSTSDEEEEQEDPHDYCKGWRNL